MKSNGEAYVFSITFSGGDKPIKLWSIYLMNNKDVPLMFSKGVFALSTSKKGIVTFAKRKYSWARVKAIKDNGFECCPAKAVSFLGTGKADPHCTVLNCLNTLLDFADASVFKLSLKSYFKVKECADYLTFNKSLDKFFCENTANVKRRDIIDFVNLVSGQILNSCRIVQTKRRGHP